MLKKFVKNFPVILLIVLSVAPLLTSAQTFEPVDPGGKVKIPWLFPGASGPAGQGNFGNLVSTILNIFLALVGSIAVIFLVVGAYRYITAYGNEEQAEGAKKMMTQAIVGLVIVILAFAIITVITRLVIQGRGGA